MVRSALALVPLVTLAACATGESLDGAGPGAVDGAALGSGAAGSSSGGGTTGEAGGTSAGGGADTGGAGGRPAAGGRGASTDAGANTDGGTGKGGATDAGGGGGTNAGGTSGAGGGAACHGLTVSLTTNSGGNCDESDTSSEINSLFSGALETHNVSAGWSFDTQQPANQSPSGPTFGFNPPFVSTAIGWRVRYQGYLVVPQAGQYCFKVDIGSTGGTNPPDACGAIYVPGTGNAFVVNGRKQSSVSSGSRYQTRCTTFAAAGPQSIQLVYQYSGNSPNDHHKLDVSYCFGGAAACTSYAPITVDLLTPFATSLPCP